MIRTLKPKRCKVCSRDFTPISSMSKVCSVPCSLQFARDVARKKAEREAVAERKKTREAKEQLKTRGDHLAELQAVVNLFVRLRDRNDGCISCDKPATWSGQWHASHFKSVGSHPGLRFNLLNIHKACSVCNKWKSGNYAGYKPRLEQKIGKEMVEWLEGPEGEQPLKITVAEIKEQKNFYRAEVRRMKKEA
ncbi:recombination protein NinG [Burkholderia sp. GbtcB21]|uniref:recombination protein NinG n=1 Tax=Burkholderia sp. GbtcB21 TaxID=2824766 RepID=UPI0034D5D365